MSKKYVVIGGSTGIGLALARKLHEEGNEVVVCSRSTGNLGESGIRHISFDASREEALSLDWSHIDGIAYCPGSINLKPFHRLKKEDFQADFDLNVMGAVHVIQQTLPLLKKSTAASVVLFSTVAVQQGMSFHASVAIAKGAIEGLTRSLAAELGPKIRVNCIAPSIVDTPLASRLLSSDEKVEASAKRHPLQRVGSPQDISEAAGYLLSDASSWVTGQVLKVDGGMSSIKMF